MFAKFREWFTEEPAQLLADLEARVTSLENRALAAEHKLAAVTPPATVTSTPAPPPATT